MQSPVELEIYIHPLTVGDTVTRVHEPAFYATERWTYFTRTKIPNTAYSTNKSTKLYYDYTIACVHSLCPYTTTSSQLLNNRSCLNNHTRGCRYSRQSKKRPSESQTRLDSFATKKRCPILDRKVKSTIHEHNVETAIKENLPFSYFESQSFNKSFDAIGLAMPSEYASKIHDSIMEKGFNYKLNLHKILNDVPSMSLIFDCWEGGDHGNTWFFCCCVAYIDTQMKQHFKTLDFKEIKKDKQAGDDLAKYLLEITDDYNITYKIVNLISDSASSNLSASEAFKELVESRLDRNINNEFILNRIVYEGRSSLVQCCAHMIHNCTNSFTKNFRHVMVASKKAKDAVESCSLEEIIQAVANISKSCADISANPDSVPEFCELDSELEQERTELDEEEAATAPLDEGDVTCFEKAVEFELNETEVYIPTDDCTVVTPTGAMSLRDVENMVKNKGYTAATSLSKLRKLNKHTRYHTERLNVFQDEFEIKRNKLPLDVPTRWSSFYTMMLAYQKNMQALLKYSKKYSAECDETDEEGIYVTQEDFEVVNVLVAMLKPLNVLNTVASRKRLSNSFWLLTIRELEAVFVKYSEGKFGKEFERCPMTAKSFSSFEVRHLKNASRNALKILRKYLIAASKCTSAHVSQFLNPVIYYRCLHNSQNSMMLNGSTAPLARAIYPDDFDDFDETTADENMLKDKLIDYIVNEMKKEMNLVYLSNVYDVATSRGTIHPFKSMENKQDWGVVEDQNEIDETDMKKNKECQDWIKERDDYILKAWDALKSLNGGITSTEAGTETSPGTSLSFVDDDEEDVRTSCDDSLSVEECEQLLCKSVSFRNSSKDLFDTIEEIRAEVTVEWFIRRTIKKEITTYLEFVIATGKSKFKEFKNGNCPEFSMFDVDPLAFWRTHHGKFPLVAKAVRLLLHGAISSTHVERIFSVATNLYSARRKGLAPSYVSYLMLLKLNYLVDDADVVSTAPIDLEEFKKTFGEDNRLADYSKVERRKRYSKKRSDAD